ncbi:hypothetical protein [Desulfurispira natronophila]|uniref:Uncharacterized protein n=1 Tax=Desulfurispira natronophila TaxID=682562 RepID=A0A7W8DHB7_9BACT|nr:hypothetical protein [Desulfurispira natronophila]MBB5022259.1 hypothetical protein [Desulfurispira natronophila]
MSEKVYLYMSSEGLVRFGPFRLLRFGVNNFGELSIFADDGQIVATYEGSDKWRSFNSKYSKYHFNDVLISSNPDRNSIDALRMNMAADKASDLRMYDQGLFDINPK